MNAFQVYEYYLSLSRHFKTNSYDYFARKGQVNCSVSSFEKNASKPYFLKLAKFKDPKGLVLSSFASKNKYWVTDLFTPDAMNDYMSWKKRQEAFKYIISQEVDTISDFESEIRVNNSHPDLLVRYLQGKISLEALCVIVDITRCFSYWDKKMKEDILWSEIGIKIKKYTPFLKYDRAHFKKIIKDKFNANQSTKVQEKDVGLHNHIQS
jgi:hypothetical protein